MGQNDKIMSVLGYLGILFLIPLLAGNSQYTRYHANQGLVLFIAEMVLYIAAWIIIAIFAAVNALALLVIIPLLLSVVSLVVMIFAIIGIVHAAQGEMKPLPVIGGISIVR